jgi:hypothetical protein
MPGPRPFLAQVAAGTTYTATVTTGAKDTAGNALAANFVWSFTTGAALTPRLQVISVDPLNAAADHKETIGHVQ